MSDLINCSLYFRGKKSTVAIEEEIYAAVKEIAKIEKITLRELCSLIARANLDENNFASAIRVFVCTYYRNLALVLPKGYVKIPPVRKTKLGLV